jgi:RecA/RadA recombinase
MDKDVLKALETLDDGNPFATFLNQSTLSTVDKWIDTGSYMLNAIISGKIRGGGIPDGRVSMLYGESMTQKTSIVLRILANAQKSGRIPIIFDTENAVDTESAARAGLDTSSVKYIPTFNIEQCRNNIHKFLTNVKEQGLEGKFIIAVDSLGNLMSQMEQTRIEKDSTSMDMGTRARAIKSLLVTATQLAAITKTPIIFTNHLYDNPGELHPSLVKNMPGGKACIYLPSISLQLMRKPIREDDKSIKGNDSTTATLQRNYVGVLIRALTAKNRFIKQYLEGEIFVSFNKGVDKYHGLLDLAVGLGIIEQSGATYAFQGQKLGYAKSFQNDVEFWESKIIPLIEDKIRVEWAYSSEQDAPEADDSSVEDTA